MCVICLQWLAFPLDFSLLDCEEGPWCLCFIFPLDRWPEIYWSVKHQSWRLSSACALVLTQESISYQRWKKWIKIFLLSYENKDGGYFYLSVKGSCVITDETNFPGPSELNSNVHTCQEPFWKAIAHAPWFHYPRISEISQANIIRCLILNCNHEMNRSLPSPGGDMWLLGSEGLWGALKKRSHDSEWVHHC